MPRPLSTYIGTPLRPKYILYGYMEPWGKFKCRHGDSESDPAASSDLSGCGGAMLKAFGLFRV